jgi:hypothetical protein
MPPRAVSQNPVRFGAPVPDENVQGLSAGVAAPIVCQQ